MDSVRILVADDHPVFRYGLRALIAAEQGMEVVGEAKTCDEAVTLAEQLRPDVVLMDLNMPGGNGIEATRRIVQQIPEIAILIVTMFDDDSVFAAMRAGARGYVLKGAQGEETIRAIRAVAHGEAIFSPTVAGRLIEHFASPSPVRQPFPELSEREREVLTLIAEGYTNDTIAHRLSLSPKTVRNYVSSIFDKLSVADRAGAIIRAREAGLGSC
jgi:DNA-binding NarL/FixJ family response regulator